MFPSKQLKIATWNASGIMSSANYLSGFLDDNDIDVCGISEHWLYRDNLSFMNSIHGNYTSMSISDSDLDLPSKRKVGKGGICLLWKKCLNNKITDLQLNKKNIIGLKLNMSSKQHVFIFQVYMPCSNYSNSVFKTCLDEIENVLFEYAGKGNVVTMGDFNCQLPSKSKLVDFIMDTRGRLLCDVMSALNIVPLNCLPFCTGPAYTNVPYNRNYKQTLIDYIFVPESLIPNVQHVTVHDDKCVDCSTHRPISCSIAIHNEGLKCSLGSFKKIQWKDVKTADKAHYGQFIDNCVELKELTSSNIACKSDIDKMYKKIVKIIEDGNNACIKKSTFKPHIKPYWSGELKTSHHTMRRCRRNWIAGGRIRDQNDLMYTQYKSRKREFRRLHRHLSAQHKNNILNDFELTSDIDSSAFWKLVNKKRQSKQNKTMQDMCFDGKVYTTPEDINNGWRTYFCQLYSQSVLNNNNNDNNKNCLAGESRLKETLSNYRKSYTDSTELYISTQDVESALKSCKRNKACGYDSIYYENLQYGGKSLANALANMFNAMARLAHCPVDMKRGVISVLHKGNKKDRRDPNNYRAISLCSTLLKVYEKIIIKRVEPQLLANIHPLQGGFQKLLSPLFTAFLAREATYHAIENNSKLYTCYLDVKQAFDNVNHNKLLIKLNDAGINPSLLAIIADLLKDIYSCVRTNNISSEWFPITKGARQGQIISAPAYIVYINELLEQLDTSKHAFKVNNLSYCCPTVADDMMLLSNTKNGLQCLINQCYINSVADEYQYNPKKCKVLVYNEDEKETNVRNWLLGNDYISETSSYCHLGVLSDKNMQLDKAVQECCLKLRRTFFSLNDCGIGRKHMHPMQLKYIYEAVVLSKALYGCELMNELNDTQLLLLERAHRQCIKHMQSLPRATNTNMAINCIGALDIQTYIDKRKLILFGQLCRLNSNKRVKNMFAQRLCSFMLRPARARGFVPDIYRILGKYGLSHIMTDYIERASFPPYSTWKKTVKSATECFTYNSLIASAIANDSINYFTSLHTMFAPCFLWYLSKLYPDLHRHCRVAVIVLNLLCSRNFDRLCYNCNKTTRCIASHLIMSCDHPASVRENLWTDLYDFLGDANFSVFTRMPHEQQIIEMLSGFVSFDLEDVRRMACIRKCLMHVYKLANIILVLNN